MLKYFIKLPFFLTGKIEIIKNFSNFCREHNLNRGNLFSTITGKKKHKGFKCERMVKI